MPPRWPCLPLRGIASLANSGRFRHTQLRGQNRITGTTRANQGRNKSMNLYSIDWKEWTGPGPRLKDIVGQERAVARLKAFAQLHESSGTAPGHILLIAPKGWAKRLLPPPLLASLVRTQWQWRKAPNLR